MEQRKFTSKKEIVIVLIVILIGAIGWAIYIKNDSLPKEENGKIKAGEGYFAEVYQDSQLIYRLPLTNPTTVAMIENPYVEIQVNDKGQAGFIQSDCPDKICINTGFLHRGGDAAACLPNKVLLKIVNESPNGQDDVDMVA